MIEVDNGSLMIPNILPPRTAVRPCSTGPLRTVVSMPKSSQILSTRSKKRREKSAAPGGETSGYLLYFLNYSTNAQSFTGPSDRNFTWEAFGERR